MLIGCILMEIFASPISAVFGLSGPTQEICIQIIRIVSLSFLFAGANIAFQGIFQALDSGVESLIISVIRQFLLVLPVAWGFSKLAIAMPAFTWTVWLTFLIAEGIAAAVALVFMKRIRKNVIDVN